MSIRFYCPYCDQLLGIARRKVGAAVECPRCHGKVGVPAEDAPLETPRIPAGPVTPGSGPTSGPSVDTASIVLSASQVAFLAGVVFVLVGVAFLAGVVIGALF